MKYLLIFCKCGRIHAIPREEHDRIVTSGKRILMVCNSCGKMSMIGADRFDDEGSFGYSLYNIDITNRGTRKIDSKWLKKESVDHILYSEGYKVLMATGCYANTFTNGKFYDFSCTDIPEALLEGKTIKELKQDLKKYYEDRSTVNMGYILNHFPKDIIEALKGYKIDNLKWVLKKCRNS